MPPNIQNAIKKDVISMGHARCIAGIDDLLLQQQLFKKITEKELSVRATEKLIKDLDASKSGKTVSSSYGDLPVEVKQIQDRLSGVFGSKVEIKRNNKGAGQIVIRFKSDKEFNAVIDRLEELES